MGDSGAARQLQRLEWYWLSPQARLPHTPPRASPPRFRPVRTCCPSTSTASWMACSTTRRTPRPRRPPRSPRPRRTLTSRSRAARRGNLPLPLRRSLRSPPRPRHLWSLSPPRLRPLASLRCPRPASRRRSPRRRPPSLKCRPTEAPAAEVPAVKSAGAPAGSAPSNTAPATPSTAAASPTATGGPATASADPRSGSTSMEATSTRQSGGPSPLLGLGIGLVALSAHRRCRGPADAPRLSAGKVPARRAGS